MMRRSTISLSAIAVTAVLALGACGGDDDSGQVAAAATTAAPAADAGSVAPAAAAVIIDVRTPAEFTEGHLPGAINLDVEGGALAAALPTLDPGAEYQVYCRSGRRSALAAEMMQGAGLTVKDLGSLEAAAAATGLPVVTG